MTRRLEPLRLLSALALVLALALLSACGGCGDRDGDAADDTTAAADAGAGEAGEGEPGEQDAEGEGEGGTEGASDDDPEVDVAAEEEEDASEAPPPGAPLPKRNVQVYFPSSREDALVGEWHEIFQTVTPGDRVKQIVADLLEGPSGGGVLVVPKGTRLRQVYVLDNGVVYLDFTSELTERLGGGSMRELLTVYSIVDSVAGNIPEVHKVGILINGRPVDTLNGHVDLRRPLPPDYSFVRRSKSADLLPEDGEADEPVTDEPEPTLAANRAPIAAGER